MHAQVSEHLCTTAIVALVGLESQVYVGIYGVESLLLQFIGCYLVHQTDATALLLHIDHHALALFLDGLHGLMQLLATIAALRSEDVASHTRRVHAHQHGLVLLPLALDQCQMLQSCALLSEGHQTEMTVVRRHIHLFAHLDERLFLESVGYHVLDADHFQVPLSCKVHQFGQSCHRTVLVHDLHQCSGRVEASHVTEVDGSLGMATATQHAIVLRIERTDMSWSSEGLRLRCGVGQRLDRLSTIVGTHTRGTALQLIDGHGERCPQHRRVVLHLMRQIEFFTAIQCDGSAEHTTGVLQHEVHFLCRHHLSGDNQVALVLTVLVVDHNHEFAFTEVLDGLLYRVQFHCLCHILHLIYIIIVVSPCSVPQPLV